MNAPNQGPIKIPRGGKMKIPIKRPNIAPITPYLLEPKYLAPTATDK